MRGEAASSPPAALQTSCFDGMVAPRSSLVAAERAVSMRLLPPLVALVVVSYIDRTALAFASIQMSADLRLSSSLYGIGSGAFFLGYALGQIPSNAALLHFGGPTWLAAITLAWGAVAAGMAAVRGAASFVALRLLLGLTEAGGVPGVWYYISTFFHPARTTLPFAIIETGITASQVLAAPLAAALLLLDGLLGLRGWQVLFLAEALPALALGCGLRYCLPASMEDAHFLQPAQRSALQHALATATAATAAADPDDAVEAAAACEEGWCRGDVMISSSSAMSSIGGTPYGGRSSGRCLVPSSRSSGGGGGSSNRDAEGRLPAQTPSLGPAASSQQCHGADEQVLLLPRSSTPGTTRDSAASTTHHQHTGSGLHAVLRNRVVLYAGCWRILHDMAGGGLLFWTPLLVQSLLYPDSATSGGAAAHGVGGHSGVRIVLLSTVPYAAASLYHMVNAWHSQRSGERVWHIAGTWLVGAVALAALPLVPTARMSTRAPGPWTAAAAIAALVLAHAGVNGANGLQTGLVAASIVPQERALGLALYNTIACIGAAAGPAALGLLHDATGGHGAGLMLLAVCLAAGAVMVITFQPERLDPRIAPINGRGRAVNAIK